MVTSSAAMSPYNPKRKSRLAFLLPLVSTDRSSRCMRRPTRTRSEAKSGRKGRTNSHGLTRLRGLTVRPLTNWGAVAVASPADDFGTPRGASKPVKLSIYLAPSGKSPLEARPVPCPIKRDVSRSSRTLGAGCDGRVGAAWRAAQARTAKSCGPDIPMLMPSRQDDDLSSDGDNKAGLRGARRKPLKPIARGRPEAAYLW
jgi:hypothetical protein